MRKTGADREGDLSGSFTVGIPNVLRKTNDVTTEKKEKTSLYVPKKLLADKAGFKQSENFSGQVLVTKNVSGVMEAVFKHGKVAPRYGENGLENDPTRQQIIVYSAVMCQGQILWYQRALVNGDTKTNSHKGGDVRLQGKYSLGFGGHKTSQDIKFSQEELVFLKELLPAIKDDIATVLGMNKGFFAEVEEELGLTREGIKEIKLLGAFQDLRYEDPLTEIQVGWVHTGIAALLEVDERKVDMLSLRKTEMSKAWWIPTEKLHLELEAKQKAWISGKGPRVESWSEIMIEEFLI